MKAKKELNHSELTLTQTEGTVDTQIHVSQASVSLDCFVIGPFSKPKIRTDLERLEHKVEDQCSNAQEDADTLDVMLVDGKVNASSL